MSAQNRSVYTVQAKKAQLKKEACHLMYLNEDNVTMWDYYESTSYANMEFYLDKSLSNNKDNTPLVDGQLIFLEEVCALHS